MIARVLLLLGLAAAFGTGASQPPAEVPAVDLQRHSVPLDEIFFDTFSPSQRAVPLNEASPALIERLRDAIPPLHEPTYEAGDALDWLAADDLVLGYAAGGEAWAFPLRILNFHEIVNDTLAGEPVLVSYCPLCFSGIVFSRRLDGEVLTFGNTSALYESDLVMLDYATGSYWWQVAGRAIVGTLAGSALTVLPSTVTTWRAWLEVHPDTLVLSRETGFARDYGRDPFSSYAAFLDSGRFAFPVGDRARDARLTPSTRVLSVRVGDEVRGYPLTEGAPEVVHDAVGGERLVVVRDAGGGARVFSASLAERTLEFSIEAGVLVDRRTGSRWSRGGRALSGPLAGEQLTPLPSKTTFWFALVAAEPEVVLVR